MAKDKVVAESKQHEVDALANQDLLRNQVERGETVPSAEPVFDIPNATATPPDGDNDAAKKE